MRRNDERGRGKAPLDEAPAHPEPAGESTDRGAMSQGDGTPAWAVVDWETLEGRTGAASQLVDKAEKLPPVPLADEQPESATDAQPAAVLIQEFDRDEADGEDGPGSEPIRVEPVRAEAWPPSTSGTELVSPLPEIPEHEEAAAELREARERADRAEAESEVLREELQRCREISAVPSEPISTRRRRFRRGKR